MPRDEGLVRSEPALGVLHAKQKLPVMDTRELRLALKYAYLWKIRTEPLRQKTHCVPTSDRCSVHHVIVRSHDGSYEVLRREQLPRLKPGALPFGDGKIHARVREVPPQLPPDLFLVPLDIAKYAGTQLPDFATMLFTAPTRVYVLLPTLTREPKWLRDMFTKVRDPQSGNHLGVPVNWVYSAGFALLLASAMRRRAFAQQRLMVWESTKVYGVDEELVLGGPGLAELGECVYVIATRSIATAQAAAASQLSHAPTAMPAFSGTLSLFGRPSLDMLGPSFPHAAPTPATSSTDVVLTATQAGAGMAAARGAVGGTPQAPPVSGGLAGISETAPLIGELHSTHPPLQRQQQLQQSPGKEESGAPLSGEFAQGPPGGASPGGGIGFGMGAGTGAGPRPTTAAAWLLQRFIKIVKRDRVQDLQALLESGAWRRYTIGSYEVSFLPPGERYPLTVDLAVANVSLPMLVLLVDKAGCHLGYRALKLLVSNWSRLPELCAGGGEGLLLRYLSTHPNPLSVIGTFLLAMRAEVDGGGNRSTALQSAVTRLQLLQLELLNQLHDTYHKTSEEARAEAGLPLLEEILEQPRTIRGAAAAAAAAVAGGGAGGGGGGGDADTYQPLVLSDYSPLRLAFHDNDTAFMASQVIEGYTRRRWLGPEYCALTALDGQRRLNGLDPMLVYTLVENLGFVGSVGAPSMRLTMRLWHMLTMTSFAFFRSPRGRWAMKFMSTFVFLGIYMAVLASQRQIEDVDDGASWRGVHVAFCVFALGNLLEAFEVLAMKYRNSAGRYFMSAPHEFVAMLVDAGVLATVLPTLLAAYRVVDFSDDTWQQFRLAQATFAIMVWVRTLFIMIPLYSKLGPMLRTVTRMMGEVFAFVPLYVAVTLGFATALFVGIGHEVSDYRTFIGSVLQLFISTLGQITYDPLLELGTRLKLYSSILLTVYLVLAAILLTNLLIAIMSYKYRPEAVRAESVFDLAEMVDRYRFQVQHHLICSPFNLVLLVFAWLPAAPMPKHPPYVWVKYGLMPLDGLTFATTTYPTTTGGRHEIPHLCYLLTLYPFMLVVANVLYYLHTPYSVIYFALLGHRKLAKELLADTQKPVGGAGAAVSGRPSDMGGDARASQGGPSKGGGGGGGGGGPWTPQRGGAVSSHMQLSARSMKAGGVEGGAVATLPRGGGAIRSPFSPASQQTLILDSSISSAPASSSAFSPPPRGGSGAFFAQRADNGGGDLSLREMALEAGGAPRSGPGPVAEKTGGDDEEAAIGGLSGGVAYVKAQEVPSAKRGSMPRPGSIKEGIAKALGVETGATPAAAAAAEDAQAAAAPNRAAWTAQVYGSGSSGSSRISHSRLDEAQLFEDITDEKDVEPPYMALLRLATLRGLLDFLLAIVRFVVLLLLGTVLYVVVMGLLGGSLGCCLVGWLGAVVVSVYRIVAGAWRAGMEGCLCGAGEQRRGDTLAAEQLPPPDGAPGRGRQWVALARMARLQATRNTYLTHAQVAAAVRRVYAAANAISFWSGHGDTGVAPGARPGTGSAHGGVGGGRPATRAHVLWSRAANRAQVAGSRGRGPSKGSNSGAQQQQVGGGGGGGLEHATLSVGYTKAGAPQLGQGTGRDALGPSAAVRFSGQPQGDMAAAAGMALPGVEAAMQGRVSAPGVTIGTGAGAEGEGVPQTGDSGAVRASSLQGGFPMLTSGGVTEMQLEELETHSVHASALALARASTLSPVPRSPGQLRVGSDTAGLGEWGMPLAGGRTAAMVAGADGLEAGVGRTPLPGMVEGLSGVVPYVGDSAGGAGPAGVAEQLSALQTQVAELSAIVRHLAHSIVGSEGSSGGEEVEEGVGVQGGGGAAGRSAGGYEGHDKDSLSLGFLEPSTFDSSNWAGRG